MLRIVNLEEIQGQLLRVPKLVDALERKDAEAIDGVRGWLVALERILESNRLALAGSIAGLRGVLDSASAGVLPAGIVIHGQITARKIREATAREILKRAGEVVTAGIQDDGSRVAEAERVARQLIAVARFKGLIPEKPKPADYAEVLKSVWGAMQADAQIEQGAVHLIGLVGPHDALIVLDRGLTRDVWTP